MKKTSQKKMFVIGAYGCGNRGDDAILQGICELFSGWDICVTNGSYSDVSQYLPVQTVPCRLNEGFTLSVLMSMVKNSLKMMGKIFESDVLLFGGGSLIHDLRIYNLPYMFFWQQWAKLCRKKVFYFSMGIGPLNSQRGRRLCRYFLGRADGVFVRDQRGYELCRNLGLNNVKLTADAAFYITQKNQCAQQTLHSMNVKEKQYCCVTASQWFNSSNFWDKDKIDFSEQIKDFSTYIRVIAKKYKQPIIFVPTVMHDVTLGEKLKVYLSDIDLRIAPVSWNSLEMAEILENASFLLGVRMHSIILAARQQVPFLALIYDEKVYQLLLRLGLADLAAPLDDSTTAETIEDLVDYVLANQEKIQENLAQKVDEFHKTVCCSRDIIEEACAIS